MHRYYLVEPGQRPDFPSVAYALWGARCDFDSDGNDDEPILGGWTELTVALRPDCEQRVDIDPLDADEPLVLVIKSEEDSLARRAAIYLQARAGGELRETPPDGRGSD